MLENVSNNNPDNIPCWGYRDKNSKFLHNGCRNCGAKVKNIIQGFGKWGWDAVASVFGGRPDDWVIARAEICAACEYRTFLSVIDWARKGIDLEKIIHFEGVFANADLPIDHEPGQFKQLWCSKCKCCLAAAIRAKDKRCTLNQWPDPA